MIYIADFYDVDVLLVLTLIFPTSMLQLEVGCLPVVAAVGLVAVHMLVGLLPWVHVVFLVMLSSSVVAEVVAPLLLLLLPPLLMVPKQVEAVL